MRTNRGGYPSSGRAIPTAELPPPSPAMRSEPPIVIAFYERFAAFGPSARRRRSRWVMNKAILHRVLDENPLRPDDEGRPPRMEILGRPIRIDDTVTDFYLEEIPDSAPCHVGVYGAWHERGCDHLDWR